LNSCHHGDEQWVYLTVMISDTLPLSMTFVSSSTTGISYDKDTGAWDVGELKQDKSATLHITATVKGDVGQTIVNTATITETNRVDPEPSNNTASASLVVQGANLELVKTVNDCTPKEGDTITYTITVTNTGPINASGVVISDTLPVSVTWGSGGTYDGDSHAVICDVSNLAVGISNTLDVKVTLNDDTAGLIIFNTAVVSESTPDDPDWKNNANEVFIEVQAAEAEIAKITPGAGGDLTYTDEQGLNTTVEIPANVMESDVTLIYTPLAEPDPPIPADLRFANHVFDLTAYSCPDCIPLRGYSFENPVTITIHYSDDDVAGINETELELLSLTQFGAWVDAACGEYEYHPDDNWVAVPICHLTQFVLVGSSQAAVGGHTEILHETSSLVEWEIGRAHV
jgi:uncharacterized repeat protein (TIGR01451 family)